MRVVQTILGDGVYTDLLAKCDAEESQNRALLVHMFLRWAQRDAFRVLEIATLLTSDAQAARTLALDTVEREVGGLEQRGGETVWIALDLVQNLEDRISRRGVATAAEFRRFVRWTMQRTYGIALHFGVSESQSWVVVNDAFLFFLERAIGLQENANAFDQRRRGCAQIGETGSKSPGSAGGHRR